MKRIRAADLFSGAGGTSTGLSQACEQAQRKLDLLAVNHWPVAMESHAANHPRAKHLCMAVDAVDPLRDVPGGKLDILIASPPCQHFSTARGGRPVQDQKRASAWEVVRWADVTQPRCILVENVKEWESWGAIGSNGRPLKSRRGEIFQAWLGALRSLGYHVSHRVLNAADYGDATTRERLFVLAVRGRKPISWPEPTHARAPEKGLFGKLAPWRAAREVIDWSLKGKSIFGRKKPLAENTMRRILAGLRKFGGEAFVQYLGHGADQSARVRNAGEPMPTLTGKGQFAVVEPFLCSAGGPKVGARSVGEPMNTVLTRDHMAIAQPFVIQFKGTKAEQLPGTAISPDEPLRTISGAAPFGLAQPFVIGQQSGSVPRDVGEPLPTVSTAGAISLVQPFLMPNFGEREGQTPRTHSVEAPLPTVTGHGAGGLVDPIIVPQAHGSDTSSRSRSVADPLPTLTTVRNLGVAEPFVMQMSQSGSNGSRTRSAGEPLVTVTTADDLALVQMLESGEAYLDVLFRMLTPSELAAAMSFPAGYRFCGKRDEIVKQVGNAVAIRQARALCTAMLEVI